MRSSNKATKADKLHNSPLWIPDGMCDSNCLHCCSVELRLSFQTWWGYQGWLQRLWRLSANSPTLPTAILARTWSVWSSVSRLLELSPSPHHPIRALTFPDVVVRRTSTLSHGHRPSTHALANSYLLCIGLFLNNGLPRSLLRKKTKRRLQKLVALNLEPGLQPRLHFRFSVQAFVLEPAVYSRLHASQDKPAQRQTLCSFPPVSSVLSKNLR